MSDYIICKTCGKQFGALWNKYATQCLTCREKNIPLYGFSQTEMAAEAASRESQERDRAKG